MSNKASNHLHELIKSLSSAEKRYFKIFSDRHFTKEIKTYITLFDEIDKQDHYDEALILEKLSDTAFAKHFSIAKNRLYHQILRSLNSYNTHNSIEAELYQYLHYATILFDKSLYSQCERILNNALKIAIKHEQWAVIVLLAKRKKRLAETDNYNAGPASSIEEVYELEARAINKLNLESELWLSKSLLFDNLFRKGQARNDEDVRALETQLQRSQELIKNNDISLEAIYLSKQAESAFNFASGDYEETANTLKELLSLLENRMELVKYDPGMYISVLTNLVYVSAKLNRFDDANKYLKMARNLPGWLLKRMSEDLELRIFNSTYSIELAICNLTGNVSRGELLLKELEPKLKRWSSMLSPLRKAGFYHAMCTLYFISGDLKKALQHNNTLLNSVSIDKTEDLYCFAEMMHLIIHYELGNLDLIPYGLKSLSRYLDTRSRKYQFEQLFTELFKKLPKLENLVEARKALSDFSLKMIVLEKEPYEKRVLEYFDFQAWAESKSTETPISIILNRKASGKKFV